MFDRALIERVGLSGVKTQRATKIHCASRLATGDQRNCHARNIAAGEGGGPPRRKSRLRPDIVDATHLAGPSGQARWTLTGFQLSPGGLDTLHVIEAGSRLGHRPNRLVSIIFAVANPGQPTVAACHENLAQRLQQLLLALHLKKRTGALTQRPQPSVEPVQDPLHRLFETEQPAGQGRPGDTGPNLVECRLPSP